MAKLRNDIMVVPRQTGDALVHPALDQHLQLNTVLAAAILIAQACSAPCRRPDSVEATCLLRVPRAGGGAAAGLGRAHGGARGRHLHRL